MKTPFLSGETPVKDGAANLQRGIETVGGWLYLTNQRLIFESHAFNLQTGTTIIPLANLTGTSKCWTKFLNLIPLLPNSVAIVTNEGQEVRFVTFKRQAWIDAIDGQRALPSRCSRLPTSGDIAEPSAAPGPASIQPNGSR
jgi:hypothetical protein